VEANAMTARANQRVECSKGLDGDVLKDQQARHGAALCAPCVLEQSGLQSSATVGLIASVAGGVR
jgi:hypothetical protein